MNGCLAPFAVALVALVAECGVAAELFVATGGNDAWSGRLSEPNASRTDGPLASLAGARDAIRALKAAGRFNEPVTVSVRGGTYFLAGPFVLTPQDSGTADRPITYGAFRGERPLLSGGRRITGWRPAEKGLWQADVPEARQGRWNFRQLWVDGAWRSRPRVPESGAFPLAGPGVPDTSALRYRPGDFRETWTRTRDLEIVVLQYWTEARLPLAKVDPATRTLVLCGGSWRPLTWSTGYFVENVFEALGKPGQWYLDRAQGVVFYLPRAGEDLAKAEVIAPVLQQLVRLEGKPEAGQVVEHVGFRGLRFAHAAGQRHGRATDYLQGISRRAPAAERRPADRGLAARRKRALAGRPPRGPAGPVELPSALGQRRVAQPPPYAGKRHVSPGRAGGARHVGPPLPPRRLS